MNKSAQGLCVVHLYKTNDVNETFNLIGLITEVGVGIENEQLMTNIIIT